MTAPIEPSTDTPVTVALTETQVDQITGWLDRAEETAGVLLFRLTEDPHDAAVTVTLRAIRPVAAEHYTERGPDGLTITSGGWMPDLADAARRGDLFGFVHTHPGAEPTPSDRDRVVDAALQAAAGQRLGADAYLSLIVGGTAADPQFTGRLSTSGGSARRITRMRIAGDRLRIVRTAPSVGTVPAAGGASSDVTAPGVFDRQVRAFGVDGQALLRELRVAVVGAGGTGSAVAVLLARLGIGHLVLLDPDLLEASNVPRVHGSTLADVGRPKVEVLADRLRGLGLGTDVIAVQGDVLDEETMRHLLHADVVFGCTDDHAGRARLSRLPNRMHNLLIDIGVLIDSRAGMVLNVLGRMTSVQPGGACLFCTRDVDLSQVAAQEMTGAQRQRLAEEGYAPGLGDPDPAVVAFTTSIATTAVTELLDRLITWTDYDESSPRPNHVRLRLGTHRADVDLRLPASPGHWCTHPDHAGLGGGTPLLGLSWRDPVDRTPR